MTNVTAITTSAMRRDDLSEQDYRDIYDELRGNFTLAEFIERTGSTVSRAWWSQYESGDKRLSWERRNELRRAVMPTGIAPPAAVAAAEVSEDASVWRVGEGRRADRIILITPDAPESLFLSVNGDVHIVAQIAQQNAANEKVTPVTGYRRRQPCYRPRLALDLATRITQLEALLSAARAELDPENETLLPEEIAYAGL